MSLRDNERMTRSIEEHRFALACGYTDGAWLELARQNRLVETLLDEGVRLRWTSARRKAPRRELVPADPPKAALARFTPSPDDQRASRMVTLAFRSPRRKAFA